MYVRYNGYSRIEIAHFTVIEEGGEGEGGGGPSEQNKIYLMYLRKPASPQAKPLNSTVYTSKAYVTHPHIGKDRKASINDLLYLRLAVGDYLRNRETLFEWSYDRGQTDRQTDRQTELTEV